MCVCVCVCAGLYLHQQTGPSLEPALKVLGRGWERGEGIVRGGVCVCVSICVCVNVFVGMCASLCVFMHASVCVCVSERVRESAHKKKTRRDQGRNTYLSQREKQQSEAA